MFLTLYHFSVLDGTFATWDTRFCAGLCEKNLVVEGEPDGWDNWDMRHPFCEETPVFGRRT